MTTEQSAMEAAAAQQSGAPAALITGASSGIGLALARQFLEHGYDVVVAADDDELHAAAQGLRAAAPDREVVAVQVDLATPEGVDELYLQATHGNRPIQALVLNAGIAANGPFIANDLEDDLRVVDLNVRSTVHLAKLVVRDMVARDEGRVLVTSSIAARLPGPFQVTYSASKAFVHLFAQGLRQELKDTSVTVTSLMPGPTDTEFFARNEMEDTLIATGPKDDPDVVAADGFKAMMKGDDQVVAGSVLNRLAALVSSVTPDRLKALLMEPMAVPRSDRSEQTDP